MKKVLVPLADGFEEIEAMSIIDVLRRAGVEVVTAGLHALEVSGAHQVRVLADVLLEEALKRDYDMIVLPGGQPGTDNLRKDKRILETLRKMDQKKQKIAAICAAPMVLRDAGIAEGRKITSYPGLEREFGKYVHLQDRVVVDGDLVTGRGPGAALEFALKLVEVIESPAKAAQLASQMVAAK
jgi:4-methyl-5(b-hydroxyethyl)-thiazole monophosphate biosynthesis